MSKEKWTEAKSKRFISSYIKEPSLWNVYEPDYLVKAKVIVARNLFALNYKKNSCSNIFRKILLTKTFKKNSI